MIRFLVRSVILCGMVAGGSGCRFHPVSLAVMAVGDAINDSDVKKRQEQLLDREVSAADEMFGQRLETFFETAQPTREMITYPDKPGRESSQTKYVVEANSGKIVALSKVAENLDGVTVPG